VAVDLWRRIPRILDNVAGAKSVGYNRPEAAGEMARWRHVGCRQLPSARANEDRVGKQRRRLFVVLQTARKTQEVSVDTEAIGSLAHVLEHQADA
jgi:hypothetical protein